MNKVMVQANKEWCELRRDRFSLALAFLLPLFSLFLFGYGIRLESKNIPIVVRDMNNTLLSREYVDRLYATNLFKPAPLRAEAATPSDAIKSGDAKMAITIPKDFTRQIYRGNSAQPEVLIDGTDISNTQIIFNSIKAANLYYLAMLKDERMPDAAVQWVKPHLRLLFNPGREETLFIVPGAFGVILWMFPALLGAVAASREKEQETIIRVYSANPHPLQFLLGKALVYFAISLAMALLIAAAGLLLFGIKPVGDPTPLLVATPLYIFVSVSFGLMLGTWANSQTTAVQATSTLGFFPCLLLSGFVYPISNIPFPLSLFSLIVPARYYIELTRDAFVRGCGWPAVWYVPLVLAAFAVVLIGISWLGLRRMQLKD
jgi:ABC-2 type transport system permease protein